MNTVIKTSFLLFAILFNVSCTSHTNSSDTAANGQAATTMENDYISGQVQAIQQGKDGYTAKIITADSLVYFATISHANLKENATQYRSVQPGETITVKGDTWKMGDETHITVRELK